MSKNPATPPAIVVGACSHGLAVIRALSRARIQVHVVEADTTLPGLHTRFGRKHAVPDVNGPDLVDALLELRRTLDFPENPVLFLTNDRMVRVAARHMDTLSRAMRISWAGAANTVFDLTEKTHIESWAKSAGLNYPDSTTLETPEQIAPNLALLDWPRILKPARPLSGFKVKYAASAADASAFLANRAKDFPIVLQRWIPGDDTSIYFCALYLENGRPIARFDGRKLRSFPMGHTTVAEPTTSDVVYEYAARFFRGTGITGPASLEVKIGPDGQPWIIEPTAGRTDFWLDLCIANGVNLPVVEYRHQVTGEHPRTARKRPAVWVNCDRDPLAFAWYLANLHKATRRLRRIRFTFFDIGDPVPFLRATVRFAAEVRSFLLRRIRTGIARLAGR